MSKTLKVKTVEHLPKRLQRLGLLKGDVTKIYKSMHGVEKVIRIIFPSHDTRTKCQPMKLIAGRFKTGKRRW